MNYYLLDTGILLGYMRSAPYAKEAEEKFNLLSNENISVISIVNYAEIYALAVRNNWGTGKQQTLKKLLSSLPIIYINSLSIAEKFIEITLFCQGRHPKCPPGFTSKQLDDNDRWIAATASLLKATLITADKDFIPLDNIFLKVEFISPN